MKEERTDEERVSLAKSGDKQAMEELLRKYAGLVRICARKYFLIGGETEDLIQEGMIGLTNAVNDYDGGREDAKSFKNFAYLCVTRQIVDVVKKAYNKKNAETYILQPLEISLVDTSMSPEEMLILEDSRKEFCQKMSRVLSDFEFKITTMYMDGMTCAEICEATGKSTKSIDNAIQRSKKKLLAVFKNKA